MKKAIFSVVDYGTGNDAGPKAKTDVDYYLKQDGFEIIHQPFNIHSKLDKIKGAYWTIPRLLNDQEYDELFFQYPAYSSFLMKRLIKKLKSKSKRLYFIIHDVESLRMFQNDQEYWKSEQALFNSTDGLIVHNSKMKDWLSHHGVNVPIIELGIFDYANPQPINKSSKYERTICFAGNLYKSNFLEKIKLNSATLEIFGSNPSEKYLNGVYYRGQMSPEELPKKLTQNFGLVWDGSELNTCGGKFGNYMRYNDPHKVSLYLSSGQPVIICDKAALSDFITKNKVGITVNNLQNLDDVLAQINEQEYKIYKENAVKLAEKLRNGFFIRTAVTELENLNVN